MCILPEKEWHNDFNGLGDRCIRQATIPMLVNVSGMHEMTWKPKAVWDRWSDMSRRMSANSAQHVLCGATLCVGHTEVVGRTKSHSALS